MRSTRSMRISALLTGAVVALACGATASAQEGGAEVGSDVTSFGVGDWINLGVRLALVVGVIWGAVHAMRWYVRRTNRGTGRNGLRALEVLETHVLGPNRTLHLVRLGDRAVLVGATQERITQLLTVDDPDEFKRLVDIGSDDAQDGAATPAARGSRAAGAMALVGGLRDGLSVMRARQAEMNKRIRADRDAKRTSAAETAPAGASGASMPRRAAGAIPQVAETEVETKTGPAPRLGALKGILGRSERTARAVRRTAEATLASDAAQERESLFDRTLASIEALQVLPNGSTAAGPRARASYGAARPPVGPSGRSRDAQIADLQRAISQARRSAS